MSGARLPPGLVDLLIARTHIPVPSGRAFSAFSSAIQRRLAHSATALQVHEPHKSDTVLQPVQADRSLYASIHARRAEKEKQASPFLVPAPRTGLTTLEEQVQALKNAIATEESISDKSSYDEEELVSLYEDLLALPAASKPSPPEQSQKAEDEYTQIVHSIAARLLPDDTQDVAGPSGHSFAQQLWQRRKESGVATDLEGVAQEQSSDLSSAPIHVVLIFRLEEMLRSVQAVQAAVSATITDATVEISAGRVGLMVDTEWTALVKYCLGEDDACSAERVLDLMIRSNVDLSEEILNSVLKYHVDGIDVEKTQRFAQHYLGESPTGYQRDLHVKVYVKATPMTEFPTRALEILHDYETRALPPPQRTYSRVISHLFSNHTSVSHAQAWDLFSHMRYVAHPDPDVVLYTTMMRACASPALSPRGEPERALDLWAEMTVDKQIPPTAGAYTAVILACARSGNKDYVHEAFRLAKQMLDGHRDARGVSQFAPDKRLYCALLEGAKRLGDLPRVRWLLAEMVKESGAGRSDNEHTIDEDAMMHVFHAYAAYRPPFQRSHTVIVDGEALHTQDSTQRAAQGGSADQTTSEDTVRDATITQQPSFTRLPPQTHADVLREANALYARIAVRSNEDDSSPLSGSFRHVRLTTRLLNAYLSVHHAHASLDKSIDLFKTLFLQSEVPRDAWSYADMLERCARAQKQDRKMALQFAQELWEEWQPVEAVWRMRGENPITASVSARLVERIYAAMIRILSLCGQLDHAMENVQLFVRRYPPSVVREPQPKMALRSARTALLGARPLIRLVSSTDIPDDAVPPLLSFSEVEILHHRLVAVGRKKDIGFLTWMCRAYEGALRRRRDESLKAPAIDKSTGSTMEADTTEADATDVIEQADASEANSVH